MIELKKHARRYLTSEGIKYFVDDQMGHHVVTVGATGAVCSCGLVCENVTAADRQERVYADEAVKRERYSQLFDL